MGITTNELQMRAGDPFRSAQVLGLAGLLSHSWCFSRPFFGFNDLAKPRITSCDDCYWSSSSDYDISIHVNQGSRIRERKKKKTLDLKQANATASGVRPAKLFCEHQFLR